MNIIKTLKEGLKESLKNISLFNVVVAFLILLGFGCEVFYEFHLDTLSVSEHYSLWEKYRDGVFLLFAIFIYLCDTTGFLERRLGNKRATETVRLVSIAFIMIPSVWMTKEALKGGAPLIWIIGPLCFAFLIFLFGILAREENIPTTSTGGDQSSKENIPTTSTGGDQSSKENIPTTSTGGDQSSKEKILTRSNDCDQVITK